MPICAVMAVLHIVAIGGKQWGVVSTCYWLFEA